MILYIPKTKTRVDGLLFLEKFLQSVINRFIIGGLRYGNPHPGKLFLSRMAEELKVYRKTGNQEHLFNIAVYCVLESIAPEHPKHHNNALVDSVTRKMYGG